MPLTFTEEDFKEPLTFTEADFQEEPRKPRKPLSYAEQRLEELKQESEVRRESPSRLARTSQSIIDYFMPQVLSAKEFAPGEKNIFGDIQHALSRPGGAVRSAIIPKGRNRLEAAVSGFQRPEEAPTFAEEAYERFAPEPTGNKIVDFFKAYPSVFAGTALDVATDPMIYATGLIGKFLGKSARARGIP